MTANKPFESMRYTIPSGVVRQRRDGAAGVTVPAEEKRRLVAAAAYFRAARHRAVGVEGCRANDEYVAALELEAVLRRHGATGDAGSTEGRA